MSTRSGDPTKKGQRYQNVWAYKHNPNSMLTRKIIKSPLDNLCEHCYDVMEWKIKFRRYKPLTVPARCNLCDKKQIFKAHRTICDICATTKKLCTKCALDCDKFME